jgi:ketosteroid isomerase-like protein
MVRELTLDNQKPPSRDNPSGNPPGAPQREDRRQAHTVDEFFQNLKPELRRPKPSDEAVAAAKQAIERLETQSMRESHSSAGGQFEGASGVCRLCGKTNLPDSQFCGGCGVPLDLAAGTQSVPANGHQYHHHYHHHFLSGGMEGGLQALFGGGGAAREPVRASASTPSMSRAESGIRKLTQDWALACNTKHLEDLIDLYGSDAIVMRSNYPPVRGASSIREFFVQMLSGGLGEVELETLRVQVGSELAFEAGRCKMLVPTAAGKRREERGKYVMIYARQSTGEWKTVIDCWSSDLSLNAGTEADPARPVAPIAPGMKPPRRSA